MQYKVTGISARGSVWLFKNISVGLKHQSVSGRVNKNNDQTESSITITTVTLSIIFSRFSVEASSKVKNGGVFQPITTGIFFLEFFCPTGAGSSRPVGKPT